MPRYVAFLRGVSPTNASMPALTRAFEAAGFTEVRTLLSSGNVAFTARTAPGAALERKAESAMASALGHAFHTIVRPSLALQALIDADPFAAFALPPGAKRVVTFFRDARPEVVALPVALDGAQILATTGHEAFTAYVPGPKGPVFMTLIEKTFGKDVTTRTWDTVRKCASA